MGRPAHAILSTQNLLDNLHLIKNKAAHCKIIAMVKANAYGHGIRSVAGKIATQVDILGVASIDEALALRKHGITSPIMLAEGAFTPSEMLIAATENFHLVFHHPSQVEWLLAAKLEQPITAWLKINTGMNRLGFSGAETVTYQQKLANNENIASLNLMSHFACAEESSHPLNQQQITNFKKYDDQTSFQMRSLCNSAGIFNFPECHYDYVRPGIALYGISPLPDKTAKQLGLKPVMTLKSNLISVKNAAKDSSIGYGARYICKEDMPIGVVAFGYGDGYPITARDGTPVLVNNIRCPLIGRVSMDMMMVDLRNYPSAKIGDPVILWGDELPIEEVASYTNNISYDLLTGVQHRVKFTWV